MNEDILLVDDEQAILTVLERSLRAHGYTVHTAAAGREALARMSEVVPGLLLLDINLPDLTGWEVLRRLSPTDRARIPVVVLSAAPLSRRRLEEFCPAGVLLKPFPIEALLRLVGDVLGGRRKEEMLDA
ncbi:MAG: response regulator [Dehalococcoidia bacterium]|nr:response regulator [Dehalococcoidia bacterium]